MNAGQTCIAVDYVVVQESVKDALLAAMTKEIGKRYPHAEKSDAYPSIINQRHYDRLIGLMKTESSLIGGAVNAEKRRIAPTLMPEADFDHPIMEDENLWALASHNCCKRHAKRRSAHQNAA